MSKKKDKEKAKDLDLSKMAFIPRHLRRLAGVGNFVSQIKEIKEESMKDAKPSLGKECHFCKKILDKADERKCRGMMARNALKVMRIQARLTDLFPTKKEQQEANLCPECFQEQILNKI